jgi:hypothetical protein
MDTTWFAVDAVGQVAAFSTGENGHAPNEDGDAYYEIQRLLGSSDDAWLDEPIEVRCRSLGVYHYDYAPTGTEDFDPIALYERGEIPALPLHIDQLPPDLRARATRFDALLFHESPCIQPLEFFPCVYWYQGDRIAYLCSDRKTVKPIPGQEERFAALVQELPREQPGQRFAATLEEPVESSSDDEPAPEQ